MCIIEEHYYTRINKFLLKALGIWPYDRSRLVLLQRVLIIISVVTYIFMQLSIFITSRYDMALFTKTMSVAFFFILIIIKYCFFILKSRSIKNLHYQIQKDWMILRDKFESETIQKYAHYGQYYTILLFLFSSFIAISVILIQLYPLILDYISPLDEPRPFKLLVTMEYFVSQDKYVYIKLLHEIVIALLCGSMILATSTQLLIFTFHSFGMFKIASHRVRYSIEDSVLHTSNLTKERAICQNIIYAVIAHRTAMKFSEFWVSTFNVPYCILAIVGVFSLSISIFSFLEALTISKNMDNAAISFLSTMSHLLYMFVANFIGQKITDYNNDIFRMVYGTSWYLMPIPSQKLILFLMQKTGKEFNLKIGFILEAKIENFTTLLNSALSYVAVMYSII
ncbi:uncharacterized protein [Anoplolepis gracilipes]|uniref:uncharacterized protein isoform X2 n=1 Tax=Anoplolepis gracilipes TaxID=354296 RepID=UPI003BA2AC62